MDPINDALHYARCWDIAKQLYTAYCVAVGGVNFRGEPLPDWDVFSRDTTKSLQVNGWLAVAESSLHIEDI